MEQFAFPFQQTSRTSLPADIQQLIAAAEEVAVTAYAPYSHFKVGAAALMKGGEIRTGVNHENASYPAGICAERSLLGNINPHLPGNAITAIAVSNDKSITTGGVLSPCGICRQTILEQQLAQGSAIAVYMCSTDGRVVYVEDATYLLPFYFSSANMDKNA